MTCEYCDGCAFCNQEPPARQGTAYAAVCTDPDKPIWGARRVISVSGIGPPRYILRPAWCRKKESAVGRATNTPDGKI